MQNVYVANVPAGASLGYTLYLAGSQVGTRTATGISPIGVGTGVFVVAVDPTACDLIVWDTGGASPVYCEEQIQPTGGGDLTFTAQAGDTLQFQAGSVPNTVLSFGVAGQ